MDKIPFPTTVDIALTGRCNLRCKHCNTSDTWRVEDELSFEEIIKVFDELKKNKIFHLNLFGGEPFYYPRIYELLEILNSYPFRVTILTNGTLIDEVAIKYLKGMRFLETVQVSIDGSTSEIHDWQRGEGSFSESIESVKQLISSGVSTNIKAVINTHNYKDIEGMVKMALELGLSSMDFSDAIECGRAAVYASDMQFEGEVHSFIMKEMFRMKKKYPGFYIGGTLGQKIGMLEDFYKKGPGGGKRGTFSTCPAGQNMLSIRSDGKVVPCSAFWTLICGDIRKETLTSIWTGSKVLKEIRALAEEPLTGTCKECKECDYLSYCNGGCRAAAYYVSGNNLKGIDPSNCLVFGDKYGYRIGKEIVLSEEELKN